ncbi:MAG: hypothetical protein ACW967_07025 [Candidatus Hodarchaeales archaeon]|jgi:nitrite reductase (NO-forming)
MKIQRIHLIYIIIPLILIQGALGFLGGIIRLGAHYIGNIDIIPSLFQTFHPEIVIFSFFASFIMFERWQGLSVYDDRPKLFTEPFLLLMIIGTLSLTLSLVIGFQYSLGELLNDIGWIVIFFSIAWFILIQLWFLMKNSQYFATTFFLIVGYLLLEINVIAKILSITRYNFFLYYVASIIIIILGERIDLAQIGIFYKQKGKNVINILSGIGFIFLITSVFDLFFNVVLFYQLSFLLIACFTIILLFYDITLYTAPEETEIRTFQKWGLRGGYLWLLIGIFILEINILNPHLLVYDSAIHSMALGFIITMLLSHAPIVIPSLVYKPFITRISGGLIWLVLFWSMITIRVGGNLLFVITDIDLGLLVELTGYLSIPIVLAYLLSLMNELRKGKENVEI